MSNVQGRKTTNSEEWGVMGNGREKSLASRRDAEIAEETGKGSKTKTPYCQRQRQLTAEDAEENRKHGEDKATKYVSLASLAS